MIDPSLLPGQAREYILTATDPLGQVIETEIHDADTGMTPADSRRWFADQANRIGRRTDMLNAHS